ncbi:MAG: ATP-binding cassette domain-containing protein [Bdellovibrionales bacterium]
MSQVKGLNKKYEDFSIEIPQWEISDQGVTALWGPSGSGKTTLFRLLLGLEDCPGLSWIFKGEDLAQLPVGERRLGVVFQSLELFPHMTAEQNIEFAAMARGLSPEESKARGQELVAELALSNCLGRASALLSGGEAQRVALARALIGQPRFLFLDEPFSNLDSELRQEARALVRKVIDLYQVPTLLITHDAEDLKALADHQVRIQAGRIVGPMTAV